MGKKNFTSILGPLVEKPQGRPTLVPVTDKRPAQSALGRHLPAELRHALLDGGIHGGIDGGATQMRRR